MPGRAGSPRTLPRLGIPRSTFLTDAPRALSRRCVPARPPRLGSPPHVRLPEPPPPRPRRRVRPLRAPRRPPAHRAARLRGPLPRNLRPLPPERPPPRPRRPLPLLPPHGRAARPLPRRRDRDPPEDEGHLPPPGRARHHLRDPALRRGRPAAPLRRGDGGERVPHGGQRRRVRVCRP